MAGLPDHYESLGVTTNATPAEIERAYQTRAAELRVSRVEDAPEELAEVGRGIFSLAGSGEARKVR